MKLTSECILTKDFDGWTAVLPQFNDVATSGKSREEAIKNAREILEIEAGDILREGRRAPRMQHLAEVAVLEVEVDDAEAERMRYVTVGGAADRLSISENDIKGLIEQGDLEAKDFGGDTYVLLDSIERYRKSGAMDDLIEFLDSTHALKDRREILQEAFDGSEEERRVFGSLYLTPEEEGALSFSDLRDYVGYCSWIERNRCGMGF